MQPNKKLITIGDNQKKIVQLLSELVLEPRINAIKWSAITKQTPNIKIGYPGQHLASLITGMRGEGTGARGNDLIDGSEVKSCSRIDPLDKCVTCGAPVARSDAKCPECGSSSIIRSNDSKWLFGIRNEHELKTLLHTVKRILLVLGDYPNFDDGDYDTLRFQAFELWPESPRNSRFAKLMTNYYQKIYLGHKKKDINKNPAPKNFWPYSYQFYLCNPIQTFACIVRNANSDPKIKIVNYLEPDVDRSKVPSVIMPMEVLKDEEFQLVLKKAKPGEIEKMFKPTFKGVVSKFGKLPLAAKRESLVGIDEALRRYLPLRDTDRIASAGKEYVRRTH